MRKFLQSGHFENPKILEKIDYKNLMKSKIEEIHHHMNAYIVNRV